MNKPNANNHSNEAGCPEDRGDSNGFEGQGHDRPNGNDSSGGHDGLNMNGHDSGGQDLQNGKFGGHNLPNKNAQGSTGYDRVMRKLLQILRHPNHFNLTINTQGFIPIDELFKIRCNEFLKFTTKTLLKYIKENNTNYNDEKKPTFILRRNPDQPTEYQIRTVKKPKYEYPVETFHDGGEPFKQCKLSSTLNYILRHDAGASADEVRNQYGYLPIDWIMQQPNMKLFTLDQVMDLVGNQKGLYRYEKRTNPFTQQDEIRSLFGQDNENTLMTEHDRILDITKTLYESPTAVYGTTFEEWEIIKKAGIPRTSLGHIHFAAFQDVLLRFRFLFYSDYNVVDVIIHINIEKAIEDGLEFFTSYNGLIMCRCDADSRLSTKYFDKAIRIDTGEEYDLVSNTYY